MNGNFEIIMKEIRKSQDEKKKFKGSLEFTENELHSKMIKLD